MKTYFPKTLTALALAGFLLSAPLSAQPEHGNRNALQGPPSAEEQLARMSEALDLSDEQAVALLEVLQAARAEREAIHEQAMDQFGPELCALKQDTEARILAILTTEQAALLEQRKEERAANAGKRRNRDKERFDCSE